MPVKPDLSWIDINQRLPPQYELYEFLTSCNKIRIGWRSGLHYEGNRIKKTDEIIKWRRISSPGYLMINS